MSNLILELAGLLSAMCGLITIMFLLAVYISLKRLGDHIERRQILVISTVAFFFVLGSIVLTIIGETI
jgi:hypothetical protein